MAHIKPPAYHRALHRALCASVYEISQIAIASRPTTARRADRHPRSHIGRVACVDVRRCAGCEISCSALGSFEPTADEWAVRETDDAVHEKLLRIAYTITQMKDGALAVAGVVPHWRVRRPERQVAEADARIRVGY